MPGFHRCNMYSVRRKTKGRNPQLGARHTMLAMALLAPVQKGCDKKAWRMSSTSLAAIDHQLKKWTQDKVIACAYIARVVMAYRAYKVPC